MRNNTQNNKTFELAIIVFSLVLPISFIMVIMDLDINFYDYLWAGFYSSILLTTFFKKKMIHKILIFINISIVLFLVFISTMGGLPGLVTTVFKTMFPFLPSQWLADLMFDLLI